MILKRTEVLESFMSDLEFNTGSKISAHQSYFELPAYKTQKADKDAQIKA